MVTDLAGSKLVCSKFSCRGTRQGTKLNRRVTQTESKESITSERRYYDWSQLSRLSQWLVMMEVCRWSLVPVYQLLTYR